MSESEPSTPESAATSKGESPPAHRISNPRSKKSGKPQKKPKKGPPDKSAPPTYPVFDLSESPAEQPKSAASSGDWPEPDPASAGDSPPQESSKRKRRRKKGKGGQQNSMQAVTGDTVPLAEVETTPAQTSQPKSSQQHRTKVDPEKIAKLALKIYLAEVSEEGVALIGDNDAKELSRRCFRLAEIFIEEESRRR